MLDLIETVPSCRRLLDLLKGDGSGAAVVLDAARPYLVAALYEKLRLPVLLVTAQPENARKLCDQLSTWCPAAPETAAAPTRS